MKEMMNNFTNVVFFFRENLILTLMVIMPIILYFVIDSNNSKYRTYLIIPIIIGILGLIFKKFNIL